MPLLTCVTPNREGKGLNPGASTGAARSQKGSPHQSDQPARELECSLCSRAKIEHCSLNSSPFEAAFSGIARV